MLILRRCERWFILHILVSICIPQAVYLNVLFGAEVSHCPQFFVNAGGKNINLQTQTNCLSFFSIHRLIVATILRIILKSFLHILLFFSKCTGVLELKEETIESLLAAACLLQLSQVIQVCCNFLMKQLHPSNCLGIRSFADAQGCMDLLNVAHNYSMVGPGIQSSLL